MKASSLGAASSESSTREKSRQRTCTKLTTQQGAYLHHIDYGEGRPVLFVHGRAVSSEIWRNQMLHLAERGYRCIAFDCRGHGRSDDTGCGYDYDTLADDLSGVIDQLDLSEITLVGHSMGCGEVVRYLTRYGASRVDRIALIGATMPFLKKTDDNPSGFDPALIEAGYAQLQTDYPKWVMENVRPFVVPETSSGTIDWIVKLAYQASLKAILDLDKEVSSTDFRKELDGISVPTLVIHGTREVGLPVDITAIPTAQRIQRSELKIYEGAPHGLMITHTTRLNKDLEAFLGQSFD